jgi:hypothetical protein
MVPAKTFGEVPAPYAVIVPNEHHRGIGNGSYD